MNIFHNYYPLLLICIFILFLNKSSTAQNLTTPDSSLQQLLSNVAIAKAFQYKLRLLSIKTIAL